MYGYLLKKGKVEVETASPSEFSRREFSTKEDINTWKQLLLVNLRLWLGQKSKVLGIFFVKRLIQEISVA